MAVTANGAVSAGPLVSDNMYVVANPSGTAFEVNPGDYVAWSGQYIVAVHDGVAYWKASGLGIALDRNPAYDWGGRQIVNSALLVARRGTFIASASFSGQPAMGTLAFPDMTGSGVNAPSGATGLGSIWGTGVPRSVSAGTGGAPVNGVAQVIGWRNSGPAGTGQLEFVLWDRNADYY